MTTSSPRIEVKLRASGTCYLSNEPPFCFILESTLPNNVERAVFLEDGFVDTQDYQPLNSNHIIQCFDSETGERVPVIRQGTQPIFVDSVYSSFTTSRCRDSYELPFITSSLQPDRTYKLCFKPTTSISHWPAGEKDALNSLEKIFNSSTSMSEIPTVSKQPVLWEAADGNDTITFKTRSSQPRPPNVVVSLSAPPICSLSQPFKFTLTFSTDATNPITVLADRSFVKSTIFDINIRDSSSRASDAPNIYICTDDDEEDRKDFLRLEGTFKEQRELYISDSVWEDLKPELGKEYILRHLPGSWWWTDEPVDEVMTYLESKSSLRLPRTTRIEFASGGEVKFKIVE